MRRSRTLAFSLIAIAPVTAWAQGSALPPADTSTPARVRIDAALEADEGLATWQRIDLASVDSVALAVRRTDTASSAATRAVSWTTLQRIGAEHVAPDPARSGPGPRAPRLPGRGPSECSVPAMAVLGGAVGAGLAVLLRSFLGHNTGQHIAWGIGLTAFMAGTTAFVAAVVCGSHEP